MHDKICLGRTGQFTSEYRSTYTLSYRYETPSEVYYFTQEAVNNAYLDNYKGHCVRVSKLNQCKMAGTISSTEKTLLRSALNRNNLEPYQTVMVFEYEVDYE